MLKINFKNKKIFFLIYFFKKTNILKNRFNSYLRITGTKKRVFGDCKVQTVFNACILHFKRLPRAFFLETASKALMTTSCLFAFNSSLR